MKLVGIDIVKSKHFFSIIDKDTGKIIVHPVSFTNNKDGFDFLIQNLKSYSNDSVLIGMKNTGHYHFALLKFLLDKDFDVAQINPKITNLTRKM